MQAIFRAALFAVIVLTISIPGRSLAQNIAPHQAQPPVEQLQSLSDTLKDPAQRQKFLDQIQALIDVQHANRQPNAVPPARSNRIGLVDRLSQALRSATVSLGEMASPSSWSGIEAYFQAAVTDPSVGWRLLVGILAVSGVLALAFAAEKLVSFMLTFPFRRLHPPSTHTVITLSLIFILQVLRAWISVAAFLAVGYTCLSIVLAWDPSLQTSKVLAVVLLQAHALSAAIAAVIRAAVLWHNQRVALRSTDTETESGEYWRIWGSRLAAVAVYSYAAVSFASAIGASDSTVRILERFLGLFFTALIVTLILQNRASGRAFIVGRGDRLLRLRKSIAEVWHIAVILYVIAVFCVWASNVAGGFSFLVRATLLSLLILMVAIIAGAWARKLAMRLLDLGSDVNTRFPHLQARVNLYIPAIITAGRVILVLIAALLILQTWGVGAVVWLSSTGGQHLLGALAVTAITLVAALAAWEVVGISIQIYFSRPSADGTPLQRSARMRTLLPLVRKTLSVVLSLAVALVVLSEIGINIGPLLAGAGIAGVAIGFGAQSLVKDVITGLFILMQDSVSVGDVVTVAGHTGLVEQISIRSMRLRDQGGTVYIIPFSAVSTIRNMAKEFSYALFDIGVSYREDIDEVFTVLRALGEEMQNDEVQKAKIIAPIEILGLDKFADSAVMIKARLKTKPLQQWSVMREFNRRMKRRFDELGIEMPFPHQTVYFGADKNGQAPPAFIVRKDDPTEPTPPE